MDVPAALRAMVPEWVSSRKAGASLAFACAAASTYPTQSVLSGLLRSLTYDVLPQTAADGMVQGARFVGVWLGIGFLLGCEISYRIEQREKRKEEERIAELIAELEREERGVLPFTLAFTTLPVAAGDAAHWRDLFQGYAARRRQERRIAIYDSADQAFHMQGIDRRHIAAVPPTLHKAQDFTRSRKLGKDHPRPRSGHGRRAARRAFVP